MKNLKKMKEQDIKFSNFESEFEVIEYLLNSNNESRAIDSFSLSLLKIESAQAYTQICSVYIKA